MNAERLKQIEEIYHAALETALAERTDFFKKHCGGDEELRHEVESLLSFDEHPDSFLDAPPASLAAGMFAGDEREIALIGKEIGHYKIVRLLGKGGMGEVYLAADTRLDRQLALKILPPEFAADKNRMSRFVTEAKSASALNHPNIITIYEISEFQDTHFIATEFIDGKTLNEYVQSHSLNFRSVLEIAVQIASALDEAHSAGIIHRDIKPDNVMIRSNGLVKILDFGIAKLTQIQSAECEVQSEENEESKRLIQSFEGDFPSHVPILKSALRISYSASLQISHSTSPGTIIGTANYMSPEQAKGKEIDARSDIFSFGVVLYEIIAGHLPFAGETSLEMVGAILEDEPQPLKSDIPVEVRNIIDKCLKKNRDERYQTIKDVSDDLKRVKQAAEFKNLINLSAYSTTDSNQFPNNTQFQPAITAGELNRNTIPQTVLTGLVIRYVAVGLLSLFLVVSGFFGYRYLTSAKQIESIAVMPFVNEGGNQDVEYLSDGMTETLIGNLSQVPNLSVKARTSVFRYKGKDTNPHTIGRELNVQAILSGRIVQRGDQLSLSLELVDAATENIIWSRQYNRRQSDLVSLQSEIARDVSSELKSKLSGREEAKVSKTATTDPAAYQAYLKGRYYWNRRTTENIWKAIEQFKYAADRDPNYALAYAGLADCYAVLNDYAGMPASESLPQARDYANRAVMLDDQLAEPHATLGMIDGKSWQWADADREFKRAIELNRNYATAYHWYSILLRDFGRFNESAAMINRAHEIDPLSNIISINVSQVYQAQRDYQASIENTLKVIELDPTYAGAYNNLGLAYIKLGRNTEAITNFEKAVELSGRTTVVLRNLGYAYGVAGRRAEALAIAKEIEESYARKKSLGQFVAVVYAGLGDKGREFEWLEKDFQSREDLGSIRWNPIFESIRDDPRYADLLKRMNLPE